MKQVLWQANTLLDRLEEQIAKLAEPIRLFRSPVLHTISRWASEHPRLRCEYEVVGKTTIQETDPDSVVRTISLPENFVAPSTDGIEAFRRAIS